MGLVAASRVPPAERMPSAPPHRPKPCLCARTHSGNESRARERETGKVCQRRRDSTHMTHTHLWQQQHVTHTHTPVTKMASEHHVTHVTWHPSAAPTVTTPSQSTRNSLASAERHKNVKVRMTTTRHKDVKDRMTMTIRCQSYSMTMSCQRYNHCHVLGTNK